MRPVSGATLAIGAFATAFIARICGGGPFPLPGNEMNEQASAMTLTPMIPRPKLAEAK